MHRRWLGVAAFRIAPHRFAQLQISGTVDLTCGDSEVLRGPIVTSIERLLATARLDVRIRNAAKR
jgi:hypothetical protein